jgi:hypothetical protein
VWCQSYYVNEKNYRSYDFVLYISRWSNIYDAIIGSVLFSCCFDVCQRFGDFSLTFVHHCHDSVIGQTTQSTEYSCDSDNSIVTFTLSSSSHSAWNSLSNCSLSQCTSDNNSCRLSQTPCFDYHTIDTIGYCAPASLCSILESCNNITNTCSLNTSVCIINSCCQPKTVCLPLAWTTLCPSTSQFFSDQKLSFN